MAPSAESRTIAANKKAFHDYFVEEALDGEIVACCALAPVWEDLGEICSLVVRDDLRRQGLGRRMVSACIGECRELHLKKIFALTYQEAFLPV